MSDMISLSEAYNLAPYHIGGHGPRTVHMLQEAFYERDGQEIADRYGTGHLIEAFERKMAQYLGKEAAVFFPSGTMAQQIALRIWCDRQGLFKVGYHPLCHLEIHEQDGLKILHRIEPVLLGDASRLIEMGDLEDSPESLACLLLELPQREIGGELPDYSVLEQMEDWCQQRNIKRHLDGARLFECLPYYQKSAAEIGQLFDSVYVSFYKGIGGIAGAILAGDADFIQEATIWKRRHGGDLISLYPYVVSADYYFERRINKMAHYYTQAKELAALFNACPQVATRPLIPVTNMFHVRFDRPPSQMEALLADVYQTTGVGFTGWLRSLEDGGSTFEVSLGDAYDMIPPSRLDRAFLMLDSKLSG